MSRIALGATAGLLSFAAYAFAGAQGEPDKSCDGSTYEIVQCLNGQTVEWDKKLNGAYQEALKSADNARQREQLRAAQRLWIQYRDANCLYYGLGDGTIGRINAGSCMLKMTQDRVKELIGDDPGTDNPGKEDRN